MLCTYNGMCWHDDRDLLKKMCGIMKETKLPERFKTDFKHDVNILRGDRVKEGDELLWLIEENGTHLFGCPVNEGFATVIMERFFHKRNFLLFHIKVNMKLYWSKKVYGEITPIANEVIFMKYIDYKREEIKSLEEVEKENVEKAVECQIPSFLDLISPLPKGVLNISSLPRLHCIYESEVRMLNNGIRRAKEPSLFMDVFRNNGDSWICEFSASDLAKPIKNQYWHGQNTSRWCYAGCILIDSKGEVSSHH